ncbi:MAG: CvpA family protein [Thioalkalivibrionaceae bacterium]
MSMLDLVVVIVLALSAIVGMFRGFFREIISVATWVLSIWVAIRFSPDLAVHVPASIEEPALRVGIAFAAVFLIGLIVGGIVGVVVGRLVRRIGLGGLDRFLGLTFGVVRGVLIVLLLVMGGRLLALDSHPAWQEARTIPWLEIALEKTLDVVPESWRERLEPGENNSRTPLDTFPFQAPPIEPAPRDERNGDSPQSTSPEIAS